MLGVDIFWIGWAFASYQAIYLKEVGFTASDLGLLNAICSAVGIASVAFWGMVSDRIGSVRKVLMLVLGCAGLLYALVPLIPTGLPVSPLLLTMALPVVNFFRASTTTYVDNLLVRNCHELGMNFGLLRGTGSFIYTVGSVSITMIVPYLGTASTFWIFGLLMILPIFFTLFVREPDAQPKRASGGRKSMALGELFRSKPYIIFLVFTLLYDIARNCEANFIPYFMEAVGVPAGQYGIVQGYRVIFEVPFLFLMLRLRRRFSLRTMILSAPVLMALECVGFGLFANSLAGMLIFCTFFGLGQGLFIGSSLNYVYELAPIHLKASAQAFFVSVSSVAAILGNLLGGITFDAVGAKPYYLLVAGLYLLSAGFFLATSHKKKIT